MNIKYLSKVLFIGLFALSACSKEETKANNSSESCITSKLARDGAIVIGSTEDPIQQIATACGVSRDDVIKVIMAGASTGTYTSTDTNTNTSTIPVNTAFTFDELVQRIPDDGVCRLRYVSGQGYLILSGKNRTHAGTFSYISTAEDTMNDVAAAHMCKIAQVPEDCQIRYVDSGYIVEISGTSLNGSGYSYLSTAKDVVDDLVAKKICK